MKFRGFLIFLSVFCSINLAHAADMSEISTNEFDDIQLDDIQPALDHPRRSNEVVDLPDENCGRVAGYVGVSSKYADRMLNWQEYVTNKSEQILIAKQNRELCDRKIYFSMAFKGSMMNEWASKDGKFAILSRFPGGSDADYMSRFIINDAALGITTTPLRWITAYFQLEYTEIEFVGQEEFQFRKAYAVFGDLNAFPVYGFFGRKTVDFGRFESYSPFTHTVANHYWRTDSDSPVFGLGLHRDGWHVVATAINGGRHLRVADTVEEGAINNFAINASKTISFSKATRLTLGAGYLHGTIYNSTLAHHPPNNMYAVKDMDNAAWDVHLTFESAHFDFQAEYTSTIDPWPVTETKVESLQLQGRYKTVLFGHKTDFSAVWGRGLQGPSGSEYEKIEQWSLGIETEIQKGFTIGLEYTRNETFVPLINIRNVSDSDAETDSVIIGGRIVF